MKPATTLQCFISEIPCLDDAADALLILADNAFPRTARMGARDVPAKVG
jgi:hypothetical protein